MNNTKVSAIIPFYNGVDWLCEAVQSVLNQTYENIEIIVVNDGSPEDVSEFLSLYAEKIIYHYQENQGPAVARNKAMSLATGDIYAFLDSDDLWLPRKVELQLKLMEQTGAMWSHHGFVYFWPNGREKVIKNGEDYGMIHGKMNYSIYIGTLCVMIDRKVFIEHPNLHFPVEMRKAQDSWLWKQLASYYPIALLDDVLGKVRMRGDNSNTRALMRFNLSAKNYHTIQSDKSLPRLVRIINAINTFYAKLLGKKETTFKEFIAKGLRILPFTLSRIGLKFWLWNNPRDLKYKKTIDQLN